MSLDSFDTGARDGFITGIVLGIVVALIAAAMVAFALGGPS